MSRLLKVNYKNILLLLIFLFVGLIGLSLGILLNTNTPPSNELGIININKIILPDKTSDLKVQPAISLDDLFESAWEEDIAVLITVTHRYAEDMATSLGFHCTLVTEDSSPLRLSASPLLLISSEGLRYLDSMPILRQNLESYVADGGNVIAFSQPRGCEFMALPGGNVSGYGYIEDMSQQNSSAYICADHPIVSGQDSAVLDLKIDGYFTSYPKDALVLLRRTDNDMPVMILYKYGIGNVIATTSYLDSAIDQNTASQDEIVLAKDLLGWAVNTQHEMPEYCPDDNIELSTNLSDYRLPTPDINWPEFSPGDTVILPHIIYNPTDQPVNEVVFVLLDPDWEIQYIEVPAYIEPGNIATVNFSYKTSETAKVGQYHITYFLYSGGIKIDDAIGYIFFLGIHKSDLYKYTVNLSLWDPSQNIVQNESINVDLLHDELGAVTLNHSGPLECGLWRFDIKVCDYENKIVHSEVQRVAVSKYSENREEWMHHGSDIDFDINSEFEHYYNGQEAEFIITIWNNGDTDTEITFWYCFNHHSENFSQPEIYGIGLKKPGHVSNLHKALTVPALSYESFTLSAPVYVSDGFRAEFYEGDETSQKYLGISTRGFFVDRNPYIKAGISMDKQEYLKGEGHNASITLTLENTNSNTSDLSAIVKVLDPTRIEIFDNKSLITLLGATSEELTYTVSLPSNSSPGVYTVLVEVYESRSWISFDSMYFRVSTNSSGDNQSLDNQQCNLEDDVLISLNLSNEGIITHAGVLKEDVDAASPDGQVTLHIPDGTKLLYDNGNPLAEIVITPIESPSVPPDGCYIITAFEFEPNGGTIDPGMQITIAYDPDALPEGVNEDKLDIAYFDEAAEDWTFLNGELNPDTNRITFLAKHFTCFALIGRKEADFTLSNLSICPEEVEIGEGITISIDVTNIGGLNGSYTVTLLVNGAEEDAKEVTLRPGISETVDFNVSKKSSGTYSIEIGSLTGEFIVIGSSPDKLIACIIIGVLVFLALLATALYYIFFYRRRAAARSTSDS